MMTWVAWSRSPALAGGLHAYWDALDFICLGSCLHSAVFISWLLFCAFGHAGASSGAKAGRYDERTKTA
ncbi:MAG: hypothetical protein IT366_01395 [Candidatus Hydrogenedentes bacterium]|nr:hypothetical protein [Candidatus Hydrogenedentota bacterium]